MKNIKSLGMEEMTKQEAMATNGGLCKAILFCLEAVDFILFIHDIQISPMSNYQFGAGYGDVVVDMDFME